MLVSHDEIIGIPIIIYGETLWLTYEGPTIMYFRVKIERLDVANTLIILFWDFLTLFNENRNILPFNFDHI